MILTPQWARIIYLVCDVQRLRIRYRTTNESVYDALTQLAVVAFAADDPAVSGNLTRQPAASEERSSWTIRDLARATGRAERTVRLDAQHEALTASKVGRTWLIDAEAGNDYIALWRQPENSTGDRFVATGDA